MGNKKVYFSDESEDNFPQLQMFKNTKDELFICISEFDTHSTDISLCLSKDDAIALISELAYQFDLVNDDIEYPRPMWEGNPR